MSASIFSREASKSSSQTLRVSTSSYLILQPLPLQRGQAAQLHLEDGVGLQFVDGEQSINSARAASLSAAERMQRMTRSICERAFSRPARTCARARSFASSCCERRSMTSRRWSTWICSACFRPSARGCMSTSASIWML